MSKDKIEVSMNVYDIPILIEELEKADSEIKKLREENQQLKKQKDDVVEYINHKFNVGLNYSEWNEGYNECVNRHKPVLLRMLGEIDNE